MQKISDSTDTANPAGEFTEGNPAAGAPATLLKAPWLNAIQRELVGVVLGAGISLNASDDTQVLKAIKALAGTAADFNKLTNKPTTIVGYGLTDAVSSAPAVVTGKLADVRKTQFVSLLDAATDKPAGVAYAAGVHVTYPANSPGDKFSFDIIASMTGEWFGMRRLLADGSGAWRQLWHDGNFNPASKADNATTLAGYRINDAYTKTEVNNALAPFIKLGQSLTNGNNLRFGSGNSPAMAQITNDTGTVEFSNEGNTAAAAVVSFHRVGTFAAYFGIDTDNQWKVGGRSMGASAYVLWHAGNFNPASKADNATTLAGYRISDAYTKTEINNALASKWDTGTYPPAQYIKLGQVITSWNNPQFGSGNSPSIAATTGATGAVTFSNEGNPAAAAVAVFHRTGSFAANIGIDTDNQWKVGGWSMGPNAYVLWHAGNCDLVGSIVHFAMSTAPNGFLKANGAWVSRTTYAKLFAAIGTLYGPGDGATSFTLPDLRGEFVRSWDDARGVDVNRPFGSFQLGAIEAHTHAILTGSGANWAGWARVNTGVGQDATTALTGATGGTETRPRNLALLACIKY